MDYTKYKMNALYDPYRSEFFYLFNKDRAILALKNSKKP